MQYMLLTEGVTGYISQLAQTLAIPIGPEDARHFMGLTCYWLAHFELDGPEHNVYVEPPETVYSKKRITDWLMTIDAQSAPPSPGDLESRSSSTSRCPRRSGSGEIRKWTRGDGRRPNRPYQRQRTRRAKKSRPKRLGAYLGRY
ncbi:hypothetical protein F5B21DRAFT_99785 [Xylaria acuta]|nr:hypothetical protein F5B21DRAFT_99785 [Xylaria acuta]